MKKIKDSKSLGFLFIALAYILSIVVQVILFNILDLESIYLKLLIISIVGSVLVFIFSVIFDNSIFYKPYYSIEPNVLIILLMFNNKINYPVVISFMVVFMIFAIRFNLFWILSFKNLNNKDFRYINIKEKTKKIFPLVSFLLIHLLPTFISYFALLPGIKFVSVNYTNYSSFIGIAIMLLGIMISILADYDIYEYHKRNKEDRRQIINTGLWKYSRHPNYFGEIVFWYGVYFAMLSVSFSSWYLVIGALIINLIFVFISIPVLEKRLVKHKFNYEKYQEETRMLLPFKK